MATWCWSTRGRYGSCLRRMSVHSVIADGQEHHGYVSDITRAWPVNGRFTGPQRALYQAVLNVNRQCIEVGWAACTHGGEHEERRR